MTTTVATAVYQAIMLEIERRRQAAGISMDEMSELMGGAERSYAKMLYPETSSGRVARWETLQKAINVLYVDGFKLRLDRDNSGMLTTPGTKRLIKNSAAHYDRKTYIDVMREIGKMGGDKPKRIRKKQRPWKRRAAARKAARARWESAKKPNKIGTNEASKRHAQSAVSASS